jgi:uncharacterized protein
MSMETAARVAEWIEGRMDAIAPGSFSLTFFGGEPLLNLPVVYYLAERMSKVCGARGVSMVMNIITNGLLLTPEVDRLTPSRPSREGHPRRRPRHAQPHAAAARRPGTFDKILNNVRQVADRCRISIGGNFDESSVDSYPALLDFLREQNSPTSSRAPSTHHPRGRPAAEGFIPLTGRLEGKPLNGTCMTSAGAGVSTTAGACDSCHFLDDKMSFLREETAKRGFKTVDGVHMGPCEIHKQHAHTIGPDGSLYACPGFAGNVPESGHIDGRRTAGAARGCAVPKITAWEDCNDCAFIPVRGRLLGRCAQAWRHAKPSCQNPTLSRVVALAHQARAAGTRVRFQLRNTVDSGQSRTVNGKRTRKGHLPVAGGRCWTCGRRRFHLTQQFLNWEAVMKIQVIKKAPPTADAVCHGSWTFRWSRKRLAVFARCVVFSCGPTDNSGTIKKSTAPQHPHSIVAQRQRSRALGRDLPNRWRLLLCDCGRHGRRRSSGRLRQHPLCDAHPSLRISLALPRPAASSGVTSFVGEPDLEQLVGVGWTGDRWQSRVAWKSSGRAELKLTKKIFLRDGTPIMPHSCEWASRVLEDVSTQLRAPQEYRCD